MAVRGKNLHMEHLEDEIINLGTEGGKKAIDILYKIERYLSGKPGKNVAMTTKFDGAPAVICGIDPSDGQFFVGTKSVFAINNPKICKSINDCNQMYDGALAKKLSDAYRYLKDANIKGVIQGDLMFTDDKKTETINGTKYITFRPNTITYAVEPHTKLGKQISQARLGYVVHTTYSGSTLAEMKSTFGVKKGDYKATKDAWIQGAEFQNIGGVATLSAAERSKFLAAVRRAEGSLKQTRGLLDKIQSGKKPLKLDTEFKKFFNKYVKEGQNIPSVEKAYNEFYYHMGKEYDKVISKNKTLKSQADKAGKFIDDVEFISKNHKEFKMIIASYMNIQYAKNMLVDKLKKVKKLNLFVNTGDEYIVTNDEGYVAIVGKEAVKLIDRLEFSRLNFIVPKNWG